MFSCIEEMKGVLEQHTGPICAIVTESVSKTGSKEYFFIFMLDDENSMTRRTYEFRQNGNTFSGFAEIGFGFDAVKGRWGVDGYSEQTHFSYVSKNGLKDFLKYIETFTLDHVLCGVRNSQKIYKRP